jgi:stage II sporulation protein D
MNYQVQQENNEEVLCIYLDYTEEIGNFDFIKQAKEGKERVLNYIKNRGINFKGNLVKIFVGSVLLGTLALSDGQEIQIDAQTPQATYTVQSGDSLSRIADETGLTIDQLKEINRLTSDIIHPGQELILRANTEVGYYQVKAGDALSVIAARYGMDTNELKRINNLSSDTIYAGQTLKVIQQAGANQATNVITSNYYTVQSGDNLSMIASRLGTTVDELVRINNLTSNVLQPGQVLRISGQTSTGTNQNTQVTSYTVRSGDNLSTIASRYGTTVTQLRQLNNLRTDVLQIGQVLQISGTTTGATTGTNTQVTTYTVKSGENLSTIASRYGTTVTQLRQLNNLRTDVLQIGQVLQISGTTTTSGTNTQVTTYTVKSGDNLSTIASRYGTTVTQLRQVNNLRTDVLQIGQVLQISGATTGTNQPSTGTTTETTTYTVKSGDNLSTIANRFGMSTTQLKQLNNMTSDLIYPGQSLKVTGTYVDPANTTYTVQSGDSLSTIANRYGLSTTQLREMNNLRTDVIYPGQVLQIAQTLNEGVATNFKVTIRRSSGAIQTLSLEDYVVGVVSAELPPNFSDEAMKAQALAARTYAANYVNNGKILSDTDSHQVYYDQTQLKQMWGNDFSTYYTKVKNAVNATAGEVITYNGEYIDALFFSTSNGRTDEPQYIWGGELPYLRSVESPWDTESRQFNAEKTMTYSEFRSRLGLGSNASLYATVLSRTPGDGIEKINISGNVLTGEQVRRNLGLRSTDYDIHFENGTVRIVQRGWGHRVGMSQYGAHYMGLEGYSYSQIIHHYYSGVSIVKI